VLVMLELWAIGRRALRIAVLASIVLFAAGKTVELVEFVHPWSEAKASAHAATDRVSRRAGDSASWLAQWWWRR